MGFIHALRNTVADFPQDFLPLVAILMVFGIPIVAILTAHQRKMAELIHSQNRPVTGDLHTQRQLEVMQSQISELRGMIQEHIINNDPVRTTSTAPPPSPTIEQRLNS